MKFSVLQNKPRLILDPYPHLVIENALPTELYEELDESGPRINFWQQNLSTRAYATD